MIWSESQQRALEVISTSRLAVVSAGPGSGKTRVFVEALRRRLDSWNLRTAGVAALSFTNVAQEEISRRIGKAVSAPHFVGTLDSFFWRFVVRPFAALAGGAVGGVRLLPSPLDKMQFGNEISYGAENFERTSLFRFQFSAGDEKTPEFKVPRGTVLPRFASAALQAKKKEWSSSGRMTHSDVHFAASAILNGDHADDVLKLVTKRFPVVLLDEYQDTNWFLSRAVLALLQSSTVQACVVGDPDQAIFQFGGARRGLFDDTTALDGAHAVVLEESHRCPSAVAAVASVFSRSGKRVVSRSDLPKGTAVLVVHDQNTPELKPILEAAASVLHEQANVALLARKGRTLRALCGAGPSKECPDGSRPARSLSRAAELFISGDPGAATRIVQKEMGRLVLEDDDLDARALRQRGISQIGWRSLCHRVLLEACRLQPDESWNAWAARVRTRVADEAQVLGHPIAKLNVKFKLLGASGGDQRAAPLRETESHVPTVESLTVHQAKGREFPVVIFYSPKPHKTQSPCPSSEWWSDALGSDEREVAFVAFSRSSNVLVLAVHRQTFQALESVRPDFLALFEVVECGFLPKADAAVASKRPARRKKNTGDAT
jgi:DNA helicase-2/ATP-dependent DNA helicase PcrA